MDIPKVIHCIGDSHSSFFSGYDIIQPAYPRRSKNKYSFFQSHRLGSVLAYSLNKTNTKEKGREKLFELLKTIPSGSNILLVFGEIDCRCHLLFQAEKQKKDLSYVVQQCVSNYLEVVDELRSMNYNVALWAVIPSMESNNNEYPTYGSVIDRNICTKLFNQILFIEARNRNIDLISINRFLMKSDFTGKKKYYFDGIHLGQIAMPLAIRELKKKHNFKKIVFQSSFNIFFQAFKSYSSLFTKKVIFKIKK